MIGEDKEPVRFEGFEKRLAIVALCVVGSLGLLGLRLWSLQVVESADYVQKAETIRLKPQRLEARRGSIYGWAGGERVLLADNRTAFDVMMIRAGSEDPDATADRVCELLQMDPARLKDELAAAEKEPFRQIVIKKDVSRAELMRVEEFSYDLPGVFTVVRPQRYYPYGKTGGQLLGYLSEISPEELQKRDGYRMGDSMGYAGLEAVYEPVLRGEDGRMLVNVYASDSRPEPRTDAYGNPYFEYDRYGNRLTPEPEYRIDPVPGDTLHVTLHVSLQAKAEELLEGNVGSIAVLNADTGAVLALASVPNYDPSVFVADGRSAERLALFESKPNSMKHRAYQERYPPGSTFKIMLAVAGLEEGVITTKSTFYCPGFYRLPGVSRPWHCWKSAGHGQTDLAIAIASSCDVYFYNVGVKLGVDKMKEWSTKMGLGVKSGIDLTGEIPGIIPDPAWREAIMRERVPDDPSEWRWYPGHTVNLSIGQGDAALTPLQLAVMTAVVLNGGNRVTPYLNEAKRPILDSLDISAETIKIVTAGMQLCVEKTDYPSGTGKEARVPGMVVVGKTGTAQVAPRSIYKKYKEEDVPYHLRDHAWFIAGTPEADPPLAIAILVEHAHHGSSEAAPLAKALIEHFYQGRGEPVMVAQEGVTP